MSILKQRGMTLVELMVAAVISLIIVFFITSIMINSSRTAMQSEGLSQAQENGRFILTWLQGNVRTAGLPYPNESNRTRIQPFADRCTATVTPPADNADCSFNSDNSNTSDRLAVQRTFVNDVTFGSDDTKRDCTGAEITNLADGTPLADGEIITDLYWVTTDNSDTTGYSNQLMCATYYNGKVIHPAQAIANGIDGMQVLYGVSDTPDTAFRSSVNRFISLADLGTNIDWDTVTAVRIAVLTRSFNERSASENKRSYVLLDASPVTFEDSVSRHIQSTTVFLPNES